MTGTLNGDGSSLTGIAATNWITNNVTANSSTTTVNLSLGNVVKFTQSADTTVSFANTGTSNIVSFIRIKDSNATTRTLTWPSSIQWDGGIAPDLVQINPSGEEFDLITLLTRDEGVTWYGWLTASNTRLDNQLFAWGRNERGQLGLNSTLPDSYGVSSPIQVGSGADWASLVKGGENYPARHNIGAIKSDNTLWVMGDNTHGQLGQNNTTYYSSPVQIPGTTWKMASSAWGTWTAVKTDGTLWAWGGNWYGELGQSAPTNYHRSSPVQLPGTDWSYTDNSGTSGASGSVFAIKTDGTMWAWG